MITLRAADPTSCCCAPRPSPRPSRKDRARLKENECPCDHDFPVLVLRRVRRQWLRARERHAILRSGELRIRGYIAIAHDRSWHRADTKLRPPFGRYGVESGHHWLVMSISAFDPNRTSRPIQSNSVTCLHGRASKFITTLGGAHVAGAIGYQIAQNFIAAPASQVLSQIVCPRTICGPTSHGCHRGRLGDCFHHARNLSAAKLRRGPNGLARVICTDKDH